MAQNDDRSFRISLIITMIVILVVIIGMIILLELVPESINYVKGFGAVFFLMLIVKWKYTTIFHTLRYKRCYFSGTSSKTLQEILLLIDEHLPSEDELQQMKTEAMPFLNEVRNDLQGLFPDCTFKCIFSGSLEERFGIPLSHKKTFPRQFNALKTDMDVMFCCDNYTAMFIDSGSRTCSGDVPEVRIIDAEQELQQHIILREDHLTKESELPARKSALPSGTKETGLHANSMATGLRPTPKEDNLPGESDPTRQGEHDFPRPKETDLQRQNGTEKPTDLLPTTKESYLPSTSGLPGQKENDFRPLSKDTDFPNETDLQRQNGTETYLTRGTEAAIEDHLEELNIPQDDPSFRNLIEHPRPEVVVLIEDLQDDILEIPHIGFAKLKHTGSREKIIDSQEFIIYIHMFVLAYKLPRRILGECHILLDMCFMFLLHLHCIQTGPSITIASHSSTSQSILFDMTLCIKCLQWPTTSDWPTRARSWPSLDDVHRIISKGFHLVAKPLYVKQNKCLSTWRYSFSLAEIELSKLVPETARKCFLAAKVIMKDHLSPMVPGLSSYYIKTIFLHTLEKTSPLFWVDDNIEECFFTLMREIHDAVLSQQCPHYWLKDVNLFDYIKSEAEKKRLPLLAQKLESIIQDPAPYIFDDGWSCNQMCNRICPKIFRREHSRDGSLVDQEASCDDLSEICPGTYHA